MHVDIYIYTYTELTREDLNTGWSLGRTGRPVRQRGKKEKKINESNQTHTSHT